MTEQKNNTFLNIFSFLINILFVLLVVPLCLGLIVPIFMIFWNPYDLGGALPVIIILVLVILFVTKKLLSMRVFVTVVISVVIGLIVALIAYTSPLVMLVIGIMLILLLSLFLYLKDHSMNSMPMRVMAVVYLLSYVIGSVLMEATKLSK